MSSYLYRFAGLHCHLLSFQTSFWNQWIWKLDPYQANCSTNQADLQISLRSADISWNPLSLLKEEEADFFRHRVYEAEDKHTLWQYDRIKNGEIILRYCVSPKWDLIQLVTDQSHSSGSLAFEYLSQIMPSVMLKHDYLTFHGVLMEYEGNGIIISAASGTGKTTHARLWRDLRRALIINGDRAVCAKTAEGWTGYGLPWSGTSGEQINRSVAIRALVVLRRGETNEAHRISALEAFHQVFAHVLYPSWDKALTEKMMDLLESFLCDVPIFLLSCRPDAESVDVLHDALAEVLHE